MIYNSHSNPRPQILRNRHKFSSFLSLLYLLNCFSSIHNLPEKSIIKQRYMELSKNATTL